MRRGSDAKGTGQRMLYHAYQAHSDLMAPVKAYARMALRDAALAHGRAAGAIALLRNISAAYEMIDRAGLTHVRPPMA